MADRFEELRTLLSGVSSEGVSAAATKLVNDRARLVAEHSVVGTEVDAAAGAAVEGLGVAQPPDYVAAAALADGRPVRLFEGREPPPTRSRAHHRHDAGDGAHRLVDALAAAFGRADGDTRIRGAGRHGNRD